MSGSSLANTIHTKVVTNEPCSEHPIKSSDCNPTTFVGTNYMNTTNYVATEQFDGQTAKTGSGDGQNAGSKHQLSNHLWQNFELGEPEKTADRSSVRGQRRTTTEGIEAFPGQYDTSVHIKSLTATDPRRRGATPSDSLKRSYIQVFPLPLLQMLPKAFWKRDVNG